MRIIAYLIAGLVSILLWQFSFATIINIPDDYTTIQQGIDASVSGDTVLVAPGFYEEDINPGGKNILMTSSHGPDTTTIYGFVSLGSNEDTTCVLRGFRILGTGQYPNLVGHPAIHCTGMGKPKIIGNIIAGNESYGNLGGGVGVNQSNAIIRHNIIRYNWAVANGGGIYCYQGDDVEISHNIIRNNWSGLYLPYIGWGAGIYCIGGRIFNNLIYDNEVGGTHPEQCGWGGGIFVFVASASSFTHIYNNTIVGNISQRNNSSGHSGGIHVSGYYNYDTVIVENNIIAYNHNGGMASVSSDSTREIIVEYNLFYENSKYDLLKADTSDTHIFDEDPLFVDTSIHDYHLMPGSPCIDAGNPDYPLDPDSTRVDIGALFYDQSTSIDDDNNSEPYSFELRQNYPNPFNAQTTISYTLPHQAVVSLIVFDITGRLVKNIIGNECQEAGSFSYVWKGTDNSGEEVSTAIYFYQLSIDNQKQVKSMIMIK